MARTKAEVRAFLDSLVGSIVVNKGNSDYNGQCVTLTKALLEFLGIPNPYAARGDAKDAGDTYIRQGIGTPGKGWLTVVVNKDMGLIGGVRYGHIWIDLASEANYESNGQRALYTTKNTRPISQGQQFINLDKWIGEEDMIQDTDHEYSRVNDLFLRIRGRNASRDEFRKNIVGRSWLNTIEVLSDNSTEANEAQYAQELGKMAIRDKWQKQIYDRTAELDAAIVEINRLKKEIQDLEAIPDNGAELTRLRDELRVATNRAESAESALKNKIDQDSKADEATTNWLRALWRKITGGN